MTIKCPTCKKKWTGSTEHAAEIMREKNPCSCMINAKNSSTEELEARLREQGLLK